MEGESRIIDEDRSSMERGSAARMLGIASIGTALVFDMTGHGNNPSRYSP